MTTHSTFSPEQQPDQQSKSQQPNPQQPIEHQNIPSAHQGLHSFLYSSDDEHGTDTPVNGSMTENDGTLVMPIEEWRSHTANTKVPGVYAVMNSDRHTQYIGYSRDVSRSLAGHVAQQGDRCCYVRVQSVKFPKRQVMEDLKADWIEALGYTPTGNQGTTGAWASTVGEAARATMSERDRHTYEEKKLKLRKAMADQTLNQSGGNDPHQNQDDATRQQQLEAAVKNDDWSAVIQSQQSS